MNSNNLIIPSVADRFCLLSSDLCLPLFMLVMAQIRHTGWCEQQESFLTFPEPGLLWWWWPSPFSFWWNILPGLRMTAISGMSWCDFPWYMQKKKNLVASFLSYWIRASPFLLQLTFITFLKQHLQIQSFWIRPSNWMLGIIQLTISLFCWSGMLRDTW